MIGRHIIGKQLRQLRERTGMRRREFAEAIGIGLRHLKNVENSTPPTRHTLSAETAWRAVRLLSEQLGREVSIDEISAETLTDSASGAA